MGRLSNRQFLGCSIMIISLLIFFMAAPFGNYNLDKSWPDTPRLSDKINPNTATWYSMARLPGVGPARAHQIVKYRQSVKMFNNAHELANISGIGPATVDKISAYLNFTNP